MRENEDIIVDIPHEFIMKPFGFDGGREQLLRPLLSKTRPLGFKSKPLPHGHVGTTQKGILGFLNRCVVGTP